MSLKVNMPREFAKLKGGGVGLRILLPIYRYGLENLFFPFHIPATHGHLFSCYASP